MPATSALHQSYPNLFNLVTTNTLWYIGPSYCVGHYYWYFRKRNNTAGKGARKTRILISSRGCKRPCG